jgi:hypothetical protein
MNPSASGSDADAGAAFVTTHWSVVLAAQGRSAAADAALETLCRTYWMPLFAFIRRDWQADTKPLHALRWKTLADHPQDAEKGARFLGEFV